MTISSSLNAGVAGLSVNASRLATISDNIANASTFGYKRMEADFSSMVTSSTGRSFSAGGVRVTTQRMIDQKGSVIATSNPTDLAIRGNGFIPVARASEVDAGQTPPQLLLTTTGSFRPDADGFLRTDSGLQLMGWPALANGTIPNYPRDTNAALEAIRINRNQLTGEPTTLVNMAINLPATQTQAGAAGTTSSVSVQYFDNLGIANDISVEFTPTVPGTGSSNEWTMVLRDGAQGGAVIGEYTLTFDDSRTAGGTLASVTAVSGGAYDPATGGLIVNVASGPMEINIGRLGAGDGFTQLSDTFATMAITKDGYPVGNITSVEVDSNGYVVALYSTGSSRTLYQIPLVDLPNANGMRSLDAQTFSPTPESGSFFMWDAGSGPTGEIVSYAREESSTDVAAELTNMIQTQRAYSSNAKVIQTVDEMLQETTNIKR